MLKLKIPSINCVFNRNFSVIIHLPPTLLKYSKTHLYDLLYILSFQGMIHFIQQPKMNVTTVRSNGIYHPTSTTPLSSIRQVPSSSTTTSALKSNHFSSMKFTIVRTYLTRFSPFNQYACHENHETSTCWVEKKRRNWFLTFVLLCHKRISRVKSISLTKTRRRRRRRRFSFLHIGIQKKSERKWTNFFSSNLDWKHQTETFLFR